MVLRLLVATVRVRVVVRSSTLVLVVMMVMMHLTPAVVATVSWLVVPAAHLSVRPVRALADLPVIAVVVVARWLVVVSRWLAVIAAVHLDVGAAVLSF